jgi:hypothetical protein
LLSLDSNEIESTVAWNVAAFKFGPW